MRRRPPSVTRFRPGAATRLCDALGLHPGDDSLSAGARAQLARLDAGAGLTRAELARLKKRLLGALLIDRVDHRSGAYRDAKARLARALAVERGGGERCAGGGSTPGAPQRN